MADRELLHELLSLLLILTLRLDAWAVGPFRRDVEHVAGGGVNLPPLDAFEQLVMLGVKEDNLVGKYLSILECFALLERVWEPVQHPPSHLAVLLGNALLDYPSDQLLWHRLRVV